MLAPREVCMHLPRKQRILGNIRLSGIVVQGQHQQPGDANDDADGGEERGQLEHATIAAERQKRRWGVLAMSNSQLQYGIARDSPIKAMLPRRGVAALPRLSSLLRAACGVSGDRH